MLNNQIKTIVASMGVLFSGTSFPLLYGQTVDEFYDITVDTSESSQRYKRIADQFFVDGEYAKAIHYYKLFRQTSKNKPEELVEAYQALIAGYVSEKDVVSAQIELQNYIIDCSPSIAELDFFNAEILRIQELYTEAIALYSKSLESLRATNAFYFSVLNGLGLSFESMKNWGKAEIVYLTVEQECPIDLLRIRAYKQRLFSMLMLKKYDKIEAALKTPPVTLETADTVDVELLTIYLQARKGELDKAVESYKKIREHVSEQSHQLCYKVAMKIAELQLGGKKMADAVEYLRDAYSFAVAAEERQLVLHAMFNTYLALDDVPSAIKTAERFITYYETSEDMPEMTLKLARLKVRVKEVSAALELYKKLYEYAFTDTLVRVAAARECTMLYIEDGEYDKADEVISLLFKIAAARSTMGEAKYLSARVLMLRGSNNDAYKAFVKIADEYPEWRERSLYQSMIVAYNERDFSTLLSVATAVIKEFSKSDTTKDAFFFKAVAANGVGDAEEAFNELVLFTNDNPLNHYYADALTAAADIAFKLQKYSEAVVLYTRVLNSSKEIDKKSAALYRRAFSLFYTGEILKADIDFKELAASYSESDYAYNGLQWLSDYYVSAREYDKADSVLEQIVARYIKDKHIVAEAMLQRAKVAKKNSDDKNAVGFADAVIGDYSDQPAYPKALYFRAGIHADIGEFEDARKLYALILEKTSDEYVKIAAQGRVGDCEIAIHTKEYDKERLIAAINSYQIVLGTKGLSREFRIQTLYKIGNAFDLYGDEAKAKAFYEELIAGFKSAPLSDARWCIKAVNALSTMLLKKRKPEAAQEAIRHYKSLVEMNIQPVEDFKQEIVKIKKQFNL